MPGADRVAWRLGAKTRVLALLWDCASVNRKASLLEWIRTAQPECHVLFIPGGYTAELQPADISIQQSLKQSINSKSCNSPTESVCRDDAVLDLRLSTMKRIMAHCSACLRRGLGHSKRHQGLRRETLARTSMAHSSMRRRWNKRSHWGERTSSSMTTTTTMPRIPRARGLWEG